MRIYKYVLNKPRTVIYMPENYNDLHIREQSGVPCLWALVNIDSPEIKRVFNWIGTGNELDFHLNGTYIGTAFCDPFVWHIFEVK